MRLGKTVSCPGGPGENGAVFNGSGYRGTDPLGPKRSKERERAAGNQPERNRKRSQGSPGVPCTVHP